MVKKHRRAQRFRKIDWATLSLYLFVIAIGGAMQYAVGHHDPGNTGNFFDFSSPVSKQIIWIFLSLCVLYITQLISGRFWKNFAYIIYGATIVSLVAVLIIGTEVKGARSWFGLGPFSLQPSEFAKLGTCLALSSLLSTYNANIRQLKWLAIASGIIFLPVALIMLQPDAGSAFVFIALFLILYRAGFPGFLFSACFFSATVFIAGLVVNPTIIIALLLAIGNSILVYNTFQDKSTISDITTIFICTISLLSINMINAAVLANAGVAVILFILLWQQRKGSFIGILLAGLVFSGGLVYSANYIFNNVLKPHQQERINVWLQPDECSPQGAMYNLVNSKMAIGSGRVIGKGFLHGELTKLNYVPEQSTDFIFCTIGEEQGFVGTVLVVGLYILFLIRILVLAERQKDLFVSLYAYGLAGILFFHFAINIGMTMGLFPIIGIPLPFISYGGSSLIGFTLMLGILLNMDSERMAA